ncbi:hypothetical protein C8J56DRAFT_960660 [Mycena floridula]|nr:hypothetical protein C8J56DRAFT_960660 [Mycena floridula]
MIRFPGLLAFYTSASSSFLLLKVSCLCFCFRPTWFSRNHKVHGIRRMLAQPQMNVVTFAIVKPCSISSGVVLLRSLLAPGFLCTPIFLRQSKGRQS